MQVIITPRIRYIFATTKKQLTPKRLVFGMDTDKTTEQFAQIQPDGSLRPLGQKQKTSIPAVSCIMIPS